MNSKCMKSVPDITCLQAGKRVCVLDSIANHAITRSAGIKSGANPDFSPLICGAVLRRLWINASLLAYCAKHWSAAACYRFPPRELAREDFRRERNFPPASWLVTKWQQAATLQDCSPSPTSCEGRGGRQFQIVTRSPLVERAVLI
jgi:hypothetical protein